MAHEENIILGKDSAGIDEFLFSYAKFCRNPEIAKLLFFNPKGLSSSNIARALDKTKYDIEEVLDDLIKCGTIDEDEERRIYSLSYTSQKFLDLYDSNAYISFEANTNKIQHALNEYRILKEGGDEEKAEEMGTKIKNLLGAIFKGTIVEIMKLYKSIEFSYKTEKNLYIKREYLEMHMADIRNIQYHIEITKREDNDGKKVIRPSLVQILDEDNFYAVDHKEVIANFRSNCCCRMNNLISLVLNDLQIWWHKTKTMIDFATDMSKALHAILNYNKANVALKAVVENPVMPLPPVNRDFPRGDEDNITDIDFSEKILPLDEINDNNRNVILQCCLDSHANFAGFNFDYDVEISENFGRPPQVKKIETINAKQVIQSFNGYHGTLAEFVNEKFADKTPDFRFRIFMMLAADYVEDGAPLVFNEKYDVVFIGEHLEETIQVISISNKKKKDELLPVSQES